jgi:membrane protein implicated in regulation of membrane protease activity
VRHAAGLTKIYGVVIGGYTSLGALLVSAAHLVPGVFLLLLGALLVFEHPLSIALQIVLIMILPLNTVSGVLIFSVIDRPDPQEGSWTSLLR